MEEQEGEAHQPVPGAAMGKGFTWECGSAGPPQAEGGMLCTEDKSGPDDDSIKCDRVGEMFES